MFMKKLFNIIKTIFWAFWAFIKGWFSDKKPDKTIQENTLENVQRDNAKIKIIDSNGFTTDEANKDPQEIFISEAHVKEIIREKYQDNLGNNYNEDIPTVIENKILTQVKNEVQKEEIITINNLEAIIEEQVKANTQELNNTEDKPYVKKTALKENFVVLFNDNTYQLVDKFDNIISVRFKAPIIDYVDNYLKVFYDNKYYVYDIKGNILTKVGFKDIRLYEDFYAVINDDYLLDVREYLDPNFKLSTPILLDKMCYQSDYDIKKYISEYKIKIKSKNEVYHADTNGNILNKKEVKPIDITNPVVNSPILEQQSITNEDDKPLGNEQTYEIKYGYKETNTNDAFENTSYEEKSVNNKNEDLINDNFNEDYRETNEENHQAYNDDAISNEATVVNDNSNNKNSNEKREINSKKEITTEIQKVVDDVEEKIEIISNNSIIENKKEELDDKNYEALEEELSQVLEIIELKKKSSKNPEDLKKLNYLENKTLRLKRNIEIQKNADITKEKEYLDEGIHTGELYDLQTELKNVHLSYEQNLNSYALQSIEELNKISVNDANNIEKDLLKKELHKANKVAKVANILDLIPFVRNCYFKFFASGMLVKTHLKIYESILKRKTTPYRESNFNNMINGHTALNGGLSLNVRNVNRLNALDEATKAKFPEMAYDEEYQLSMNNLKNSLLSEQEKMLKKKKIIAKYNLAKKAIVRERKKAA